MPKIILLFDMDGVLIHSDGYYTSLQSAIKLIGQSLGVKDANLTRDQISKLEAAGIYHIWDHLTFFSSSLLAHIWKEDPSVRLPAELCLSGEIDPIFPEIDFGEYTREIKAGHQYSLTELTELIGDSYHHVDSALGEYLAWLADVSREVYISPVLPIMQEFILGSDQFSATYQLSSQLELRSYPEQHDRPGLTKENYHQLQKWLGEKEHHAAIFTSRPNLPPEKGVFGTPEAEIGAKIAGLGHLPIIGAGSLDWIAARSGVPARSYYKPHPIHALAAMQAAAGRDIAGSLEKAVDLVGQPGNPQFVRAWRDFSQAQVHVFEDSPGGLNSAQQASQILSQAGIQIQVNLIGIGQHTDKTDTLLRITDQIYPDLNSCPLIDILTGE